jgi:hypothetical protein
VGSFLFSLKNEKKRKHTINYGEWAKEKSGKSDALGSPALSLIKSVYFITTPP